MDRAFLALVAFILSVPSTDAGEIPFRSRCRKEAEAYVKAAGINEIRNYPGPLELVAIQPFSKEHPSTRKTEKYENGRLRMIEYAKGDRIVTETGAGSGIFVRDYSGEKLSFAFPFKEGGPSNQYEVEFDETCRIRRATLRTPAFPAPFAYDVDQSLCESLRKQLISGQVVDEIPDSELIRYGFVKTAELAPGMDPQGLKPWLIESVSPAERKHLLSRQLAGCAANGLLSLAWKDGESAIPTLASGAGATPRSEAVEPAETPKRAPASPHKERGLIEVTW